MGAYKYMNEIWRKKQSETMRYLQRVSFLSIQKNEKLIFKLGPCLAIPQPERHSPRFTPNSPREGTTSRLQGHSGFCRLQELWSDLIHLWRI